MAVKHQLHGLEGELLFCIGSPAFLTEITPEGKRIEIRVKQKGGAATIEEIWAWLRRRNLTLPSSATLYRKIGKLRKEKLIRYGDKRGIYEITEEGKELFEEEKFRERGKSLLHAMAKEPVWAFFEFWIKNGEPEYMDIHIRVFQKGYIQRILHSMDKHTTGPTTISKIIEGIKNGGFRVKGDIASKHLGFSVLMALVLWSEGVLDLMTLLKGEPEFDEKLFDLIITKTRTIVEEKEFKELEKTLQSLVEKAKNQVNLEN